MLGHSIKRRLVLPNDVQEIPKLAGFIDEFCETCGIDMSTTMSLNLAIEEAVVNVMDYAYPNGGKGDVYIEAECDNDVMTFIIRDNGIPFDPTKASEVDTTLSAEERPIGGLGIHLVRTIMDTEEYSYTDGQNVLTLKKKLNK